jgi:predicted ATPase/class 3 adenylate cyclase
MITPVREDLPSGTVTFLFTDIDGSTRLLHSLGAEGYAEALAEHRRIIREACATEGGVEVDTQGDAFFFAFPTAPGALAAALAFTDALASGQVQVRVGLHTGTPLLTDEGYVGDDVHRAARIAGCGHGGQVLVSAASAQLVERELRDLGEHRLKDLSAPERVYQLGDGDFPALRSLYRTNLPVPATPFLGREQELAEVVELLVADHTRLLTLTGPGGTGKTRLALQAAGLASDAYPDGVYWIPLAPLRDPTLVLATAGQTLGSKNGLAEHISDKAMLCLFDNFEQVVDAGTELAGLLAECPNLDVLVTSRERLRVSAEQTYPVPPLAESDGEALFTARARAVDPAFTPSESVRELCLRLDDLPLALELAAARTALFSPEQLLDKLSQRLDLLKGSRDADPRQQTLRATIEWSYDLLSDDEKRLFRRLAVFSGGCTYEAAEEIAEADPDTLQSLLDKSLARKRDSSLGPRYWMLETIREYAAGELEESGEAEPLARRHFAHYAALAEDVDKHGKVGEYQVGRIEEERDNLRSAFDTALTLNPEQALELAGWLGLYWNRRGQYREGRQRLAAALAAAPGASASVRARALGEAGNLALFQADLDAAEELGREALALAREEGDRSGSGYALNLLAGVSGNRGDHIAAIEQYEASLAEYEAAGDQWGRLLPLQNLASTALARGDYQGAISLLRDKIATVGGRDTYSLALAVGLLGFALAGNGEDEEARQSFEQSLEMCRAQGYSRLEAEILSGLADLLRTARPAQALEYYRESIELACTIGYLPFVHYCLWRIAEIALAGGDAREAATLLGVVAGFVERLGSSFNPDEEEQFHAAIRHAREALGNDVFDAAWAAGGGLSLDQAVELSLTVTASPAVRSERA